MSSCGVRGWGNESEMRDHCLIANVIGGGSICLESAAVELAMQLSEFKVKGLLHIGHPLNHREDRRFGRALLCLLHARAMLNIRQRCKGLRIQKFKGLRI